MPVIARFYGIIIRMLCSPSLGGRIHAFYGDSEMVVNLMPMRIIGGDLPEKVRDLTLRWAADHQQELLAAWGRMLAAQKVSAPGPVRR